MAVEQEIKPLSGGRDEVSFPLLFKQEKIKFWIMHMEKMAFVVVTLGLKYEKTSCDIKFAQLQNNCTFSTN